MARLFACPPLSWQASSLLIQRDGPGVIGWLVSDSWANFCFVLCFYLGLLAGQWCATLWHFSVQEKNTREFERTSSSLWWRHWDKRKRGCITVVPSTCAAARPPNKKWLANCSCFRVPWRLGFHFMRRPLTQLAAARLLLLPSGQLDPY